MVEWMYCFVNYFSIRFYRLWAHNIGDMWRWLVPTKLSDMWCVSLCVCVCVCVILNHEGARNEEKEKKELSVDNDEREISIFGFNTYSISRSILIWMSHYHTFTLSLWLDGPSCCFLCYCFFFSNIFLPSIHWVHMRNDLQVVHVKTNAVSNHLVDQQLIKRKLALSEWINIWFFFLFSNSSLQVKFNSYSNSR